MIYVVAAINLSLLTFKWYLPFIPISLIAVCFSYLFLSCFPLFSVSYFPIYGCLLYVWVWRLLIPCIYPSLLIFANGTIIDRPTLQLHWTLEQQSLPYHYTGSGIEQNICYLPRLLNGASSRNIFDFLFASFAKNDSQFTHSRDKKVDNRRLGL